jgi:hypothetical protein
MGLRPLDPLWLIARTKKGQMVMSEQRTKSIKIRVSEEELEQLKQRCTKARLAEWMREICLGVETKRKTTPPPPRTDPELLYQLARIGNNINQIARKVNADRSIDKVKLLVVLDEIRQELARLRNQ